MIIFLVSPSSHLPISFQCATRISESSRYRQGQNPQICAGTFLWVRKIRLIPTDAESTTTTMRKKVKTQMTLQQSVEAGRSWEMDSPQAQHITNLIGAITFVTHEPDTNTGEPDIYSPFDSEDDRR